jgi:hypothetical protein
MPKPLQPSTYTFRDLIDGGFLYVDKTRYLYELVRYAKGVYFLARPRRFGKSLMVSTLAEIFQGNRELFRGLWLDSSDYQWQVYPVIRLDFSQQSVKDADTLEKVIDLYNEEIAQNYGITLRGFDYQSRFRNLITQLGKERKVVILIDEYDKPMLDNIENLPAAQRIRETLKSFYTVIKATDSYIRFVFITGISKFSRVGVFSGLNHLEDLTMRPTFATALGITEDELRQDFQEHLIAFAQQEQVSMIDLLQKIRDWYNGFCFVEGCQSVYNPFSTLQLLKTQRFSNYWFESGTPTFLIKLIKERGYDVGQLEKLELSELGFSTYELESLEIIPLLFQTGYLTIKSYDKERSLYQLDYPNAEVENAFLTYLLAAFSTVPKGLNAGYLWQLLDALRANNFDRFFEVLAVFFANVPYDLHLPQEKYYQTVFYLIFKLLGIYADAEVKTNQGRIDAILELKERIFLFEFKLDGSAADAIQQIKTHNYAQKYRLTDKPLTLVGVNFASDKRTISEWQVENDGATV